MTINSKDKGKRGERAWSSKLQEHGFSARRSQQYCGSANSADVICDSLPNIHFEVKYTERLNLYDAMHQAIQDCGNKIPVVSYRRNNSDWLVTMRADDWISLIKETEHVKSIFCPDCKSSNVSKNGITYKQKQKYLCNNNDCERSSFDLDI